MPAEQAPARPVFAVEDARQVRRLARRRRRGPVDAAHVARADEEAVAGAQHRQRLALRDVDRQRGGAVGGHAADAPLAARADVRAAGVVERQRREVAVGDREHLLHPPVGVDAVERGLGLALSRPRQRARRRGRSGGGAGDLRAARRGRGARRQRRGAAPALEVVDRRVQRRRRSARARAPPRRRSRPAPRRGRPGRPCRGSPPRRCRRRGACRPRQSATRRACRPNPKSRARVRRRRWRRYCRARPVPAYTVPLLASSASAQTCSAVSVANSFALPPSDRRVDAAAGRGPGDQRAVGAHRQRRHPRGLQRRHQARLAARRRRVDRVDASLIAGAEVRRLPVGRHGAAPDERGVERDRGRLHPGHDVARRRHQARRSLPPPRSPWRWSGGTTLVAAASRSQRARQRDEGGRGRATVACPTSTRSPLAAGTDLLSTPSSTSAGRVGEATLRRGLTFPRTSS